MRRWLNTRTVLVGALLIAAPGAALAQLFVTWVPGHLGLLRLDRELSQCRQKLEAQCDQCMTLRAQTDKLRHAPARDQIAPAWLMQRDRRAVFDRLADAFRDAGVSIERLTLDNPRLYAAASRSSLLACEQVKVDCTGDYPALAACLDRVAGLGLPVRFSALSWARSGARLRLTLELQIPFLPDDSLRVALADDAGLVEDDDGR